MSQGHPAGAKEITEWRIILISLLLFLQPYKETNQDRISEFLSSIKFEYYLRHFLSERYTQARRESSNLTLQYFTCVNSPITCAVTNLPPRGHITNLFRRATTRHDRSTGVTLHLRKWLGSVDQTLIDVLVRVA